MPEQGKTAVHPVPLLFFLSVVTLIAAYKIHDAAGAVPFLFSAAAFAALVGWVIGRRWRLYPWQVGLMGAVPALVFLLWRFFTQETPEQAVENISLFLFHPLLVAITGHFGTLVGRWQSLKSRPDRSDRQ